MEARPAAATTPGAVENASQDLRVACLSFAKEPGQEVTCAWGARLAHREMGLTDLFRKSQRAPRVGPRASMTRDGVRSARVLATRSIVVGRFEDSRGERTPSIRKLAC